MTMEETASYDKPYAQNIPASKLLPVIEVETSSWESLVADHIPLVRRLASKFMYYGVPLEDLIRVGNLGLGKAAQTFDQSRGESFSSFAVPVIVEEIKIYFRDLGGSGNPPGYLQTRKTMVDRAADDLAQTLGRSPTVAEIAQTTGISVEEVNQTL